MKFELLWKILIWALFIWGVQGLLTFAINLEFPNVLAIFHVIAAANPLLLRYDRIWFRVILGVGWILNGLFSWVIPFGFIVSFSDPVASLGVKVLGLNVFSLQGIDQIATYFLTRGFLFILIGIALMSMLRFNRPQFRINLTRNPEPDGRINSESLRSSP